MAITIDDFSKIWASTSPLTPYSFSDDNYKQGWNFVGATPPSRQMWDFIQKNNDEKLKYLLDNFDDYAKKTDLDDYLPLAGGTMTGTITSPNVFANCSTDDDYISLCGGTDGDKGAVIALSGKDRSTHEGWFQLYAKDGSNTKALEGKPDGSLKWDGNQVGLQVNTNKFIRLGSNESVTFSMGGTPCICTIIAKRSGNYAIHIVDYWDAPATAVNVGNPITVTHSTNSSNVTIKNNTTSAMVVQVIMSQIEW